jgi:hypothetical protein
VRPRAHRHRSCAGLASIQGVHATRAAHSRHCPIHAEGTHTHGTHTTRRTQVLQSSSTGYSKNHGDSSNKNMPDEHQRPLVPTQRARARTHTHTHTHTHAHTHTHTHMCAPSFNGLVTVFVTVCAEKETCRCPTNGTQTAQKCTLLPPTLHATEPFGGGAETPLHTAHHPTHTHTHTHKHPVDGTPEQTTTATATAGQQAIQPHRHCGLQTTVTRACSGRLHGLPQFALAPL